LIESLERQAQRSLARLNILQKGNLKGTGAGCPCVLKDNLVGKKTGWLNRGNCLELSKRKFTTFRRKSRQLRRTTRMLLDYAGRKLAGPKRS